jgi:hypothetical protein
MYAGAVVASIAILGLIGLCGYVIYLWQKDKREETKRLYAWQDDILDRIGSENIERYALCRRVKYEMTAVKSADEKVADDINKTNAPKKFVHNR